LKERSAKTAETVPHGMTVESGRAVRSESDCLISLVQLKISETGMTLRVERDEQPFESNDLRVMELPRLKVDSQPSGWPRKSFLIY
jgi:hypothetical protein